MKKLKLKKMPIIIGITLLIITTITILLIFFNPLIKIKLKGRNETIEVYSKYIDKGAKVSGTKNKYKTTGKVNTSKLGTYTITYKIKFLQTTKKVKRKVKVVDTKSPTITLSQTELTIYKNQTFNEPDYEVSDNYDKKLKVKIDNQVDSSKTGEYMITYNTKDSSNNKASATCKVTVKENVITNQSGITYINGILIVNKKYSLPSTYSPGVDPTANQALQQLQAGAKQSGFNIPLLSGFRSYQRQTTLYNNYVARDGQALADTYSAKPGHSEHQSGLAFDVGQLDNNYGETPAGKWLATNAHKYGFIIRYLKGKENITGYQYEPWHIRYVGIEHATNIYNRGITLEEYLNIA